jgi:hypothetical protein
LVGALLLVLEAGAEDGVGVVVLGVCASLVPVAFGVLGDLAGAGVSTWTLTVSEPPGDPLLGASVLVFGVGSTEPCTGPALTVIGGTTPDSAELEIETETGLEEPADSLLSEDSVEELDLLEPSEISMPSRPDA